MRSQFIDIKSLSIFLAILCFFAKFSYCFKFYDNIITGSRVMTISNHRGLIRNPEMGTTHACVFPNIWKPGQVGILNLVWMFLIKCYWKLVLFLSCYRKIGLINDGSEDKMAKEKKRCVIKRENLNFKIMKTVYKRLNLIMKYIM